MKINLTDNNINRKDNVYSRDAVASLFPFADRSIAQLCRENENLLIYPHCIEDFDDKIANSSVMSIQNTSAPDKVRLITKNIMGFIGVGDLQIKIKSRFDEGRDDFFLHYMLQRVMSFNLFDLSHNNEMEDVFDFLMFMLPYFLKVALRQGVYREYKHFEHNDANIKGTIDVSRHIALNVPFAGNVAYNTREHSHDNSMTQLIRHTIEFMKTKRYGNAVLNIDRDVVENVHCIVEHTPSYNKSERGSVISKNLRYKSHPYYTAYIPLQMLCLQILRMEEVKYGESEEEICGILFDGSWLWEEYVNLLLQPLHFLHPQNRLKKGAIYLFEDRNEMGRIVRSGERYPDFYKEGIVLDAKYKRFENYERVSELDRNDIHQVITYMANLKATHGAFVAPLEHGPTIPPISQLKDSVSKLAILGIEIAKEAHSYAEFCQAMKLSEDAFVSSIINFQNQ